MVQAVVGANWGDEGKGKITDMLAREVRYHRPFSGRCKRRPYDRKQLWESSRCIRLPSGVFYNHTTSIIGNGVALDIPVLFQRDPEHCRSGAFRCRRFLYPTVHRL